MNEFIEKLIGKLEKELYLADKDKKEANVLQFDRAVGYGNGIAVALEIVNQLAEEFATDINVGSKNQGWIPCSKSLPFTTGYYLVTIKGFNRPMYAWWLSTEKIWHYLNSTKVIDDVIAWCELPAPYQPKGE